MHVLGFFLSRDLLASFCPEEKRIPMKGDGNDFVAKSVNALAALNALKTKASEIFPEREALSFFCESKVDGIDDQGHVLAFADNTSLWFDKKDCRRLQKKLRGIGIKLGLPEDVRPKWHRVIC